MGFVGRGDHTPPRVTGRFSWPVVGADAHIGPPRYTIMPAMIGGAMRASPPTKRPPIDTVGRGPCAPPPGNLLLTRNWMICIIKWKGVTNVLDQKQYETGQLLSPQKRLDKLELEIAQLKKDIRQMNDEIQQLKKAI